jgi:hypothetical protein
MRHTRKTAPGTIPRASGLATKKGCYEMVVVETLAACFEQHCDE